ncbi:MAG: 4Fe-4S binding protein [Anaerolineae bacterium]
MYLHADSSKCSGCRACQVACALYNAGKPFWGRPSDRPDGSYGENNPKKAALAIVPLFPAPGVFKVRTCTQCGECAKVCPADCIVQNKSGAYSIDQARCLGKSCLKCAEVCPEEVIFIHEDYPAPWQCNLCGQCVQSCGMDVLSIQ